MIVRFRGALRSFRTFPAGCSAGGLARIESSTYDPRGGGRGRCKPCFVVAVVLLFFAGCASPIGKTGSVDQLHLLVTSVALEFDKKPGPDGVGVRVYASRKDSNEAIPITEGTLDLLLYDGMVPPSQLASYSPRKTWTYPATQLKPHLHRTSIGTSYRFAALWGDEKPTTDRVTIVARYTASGGKQIYSAPSSVPVALDK